MSSRSLSLVGLAVAIAAGGLGAQSAAPTTLTLGDAARRAAEHGTAAAAARARAGQADARRAQRRADFMPNLATTAQAGARTFNTASLGIELPGADGESPFDPRGEVQGPVRSFDLRTQLTQRIIDVPAMLRWRAADAEAEAADADADATAEASAERGATAYLQVLRAEARIRAREADSSLAAELLDIARRQLAAGVGIALDVTRAESQLADTRARLVGIRGDRDRALVQLHRELAIAHGAPLVLADSLALPADAAAEDDHAAIEAAIARRADVKAADAGERRARYAEKATRAEGLPTISFFADQGATGRYTDRMLDTYSYGVQVSIPGFDGRRRSSRRAEQRARLREAEAEAIDTRSRVETEVRTALVSLASAREGVAAARVRLGLAEQEVAQAQERFRNGVSGSADVVTASIALNGARDLHIDALTSWHLARVALARAQGTTTAMR